MPFTPLTEAATDSLRVLVVDDNASILRFLTAAFGSQQCVVAEAGTAEAAIELLRARSFDLVVSDIKMPGLSGLDLLRAVKRRQPGTPVALITGAPSVTSAVFGLRHGAYDYLPKPFSVKEIQELIARVRRDRLEHTTSMVPAGLSDELARRQFGVEVLFRIGELALDGIDPEVFTERVLGYSMQSLTGCAAVLIVRQEDGTMKRTERGEAPALAAVTAAVQSAFERLAVAGTKEAVALGERSGLSMIAAAVPGLGNAMGVLCVARTTDEGVFLPDEKELLLGYARTTAVAIQKILLRENLEKNLIDTITAFVNAIESKDLYLKGHSARVSLYASEIGRTMGLGEMDVLVLARSGMLHDLGKLVMLDSILRKPGKLTPEEYALIQGHPVVGDRILEPLRFLSREAQGVRHHHERYDGKGYPDGLAGDNIPLIARVVTVADVFDAMTSDRPYRMARPLDVARADVLAIAGSQVDPGVAEVFSTIPITRLGEISAMYQAVSDAAEPIDPLAKTFGCAQAAAVMAS
jgi:response regulator RpfG family c-di-GMP phosphodiesterase